MGMAVDHAGHHHPALALDQIVDLCRSLFSAPQDLFDPAIVADQQAGEPLDLTLLVKGDAVHIVDQRIGQRRACQGGKGEGAGGKQRGKA